GGGAGRGLWVMRGAWRVKRGAFEPSTRNPRPATRNPLPVSQPLLRPAKQLSRGHRLEQHVRAAEGGALLGDCGLVVTGEGDCDARRAIRAAKLLENRETAPIR